MVEKREHSEELTTLLRNYTKNEVDFLRRYSHIPIEQQEYYVKENMLGFLGEFVGEIPYKRITYLLQEDGAYYAGIRVRDSYERAAEIAGGIGTRTWYETEGFKRAEDELILPRQEDDHIIAATILSPPKIADYGFAFHFEKGGHNSELESDVLYTYILEYPERNGSLRNTHMLARQLATREETETAYQKSEDYLTTPFLYDENYDGNPLASLLHTLDIDDRKIADSQRFQQEILDQLHTWMRDYFQGVYHAANVTDSPEAEQLYLQDLQQHLTAIYNKAGIIKKKLDGHEIKDQMIQYFEKHQVLAEFDSHTRGQELAYYAGLPVMTPVRKSDCPPLSGGQTSGYVSSLDIAAGFSGGATLGQVFTGEQIIQSPGSHNGERTLRCYCPLCDPDKRKSKIDAVIKDGKIQCPRCEKSVTYNC
ncbi:MAG TPA: hypothetical protein VJL83_05805 [Patescibacteria group bacterium]|nr:hypothetical protein [Patescibacteria group bacterium]